MERAEAQCRLDKDNWLGKFDIGEGPADGVVEESAFGIGSEQGLEQLSGQGEVRVANAVAELDV